jgi:hypothetical protein
MWYIDSGATDHIIGDLNKLTMHEPYTGADQIHAANGSGMNITRIGTSIIPTPTHNLSLNNVLHVPSAHKNLVSVHRFTLDNDTFIEFHPYFFLIKDRKMKQVLLRGLCKGGMYPLPSSTSKFCKLVFNAIRISVNRWHSHLGHPSRDIVRHVVSKNNLPCASFDSSSQSVCDACTCAKAHQLTYSISASLSSAPLELIFLMCGDLLMILLVARNTMSPLLMITVNSHGFICSVTNLMCSNSFLNFSPLSSACLIRRSS